MPLHMVCLVTGRPPIRPACWGRRMVTFLCTSPSVIVSYMKEYKDTFRAGQSGDGCVRHQDCGYEGVSGAAAGLVPSLNRVPPHGGHGVLAALKISFPELFQRCHFILTPRETSTQERRDSDAPHRRLHRRGRRGDHHPGAPRARSSPTPASSCTSSPCLSATTRSCSGARALRAVPSATAPVWRRWMCRCGGSL